MSLAGEGADGVTAGLEALSADLRHVMAVAGAAAIGDLDPSMVSSTFRPPG